MIIVNQKLASTSTLFFTGKCIGNFNWGEFWSYEQEALEAILYSQTSHLVLWLQSYSIRDGGQCVSDFIFEHALISTSAYHTKDIWALFTVANQYFAGSKKNGLGSGRW